MDFFQKFWDTVGDDLEVAVEELRRKMTMLGSVNHTFLSLIPKKKEPQAMSDFRPIAFCNTIYKVVTKIIANRLKGVLKDVIFEEQSGFTLGRSIAEGIIISHKTIHKDRKTREACMVLKLDILKAYDLVDRQFLMEVLEMFVFDGNWINWIKSCISTVKFSIMVNGAAHGFFSTMRGLRQGDPISTFLFVIMAEVLGRGISTLRGEGKWLGVLVANGVDTVTHR